MSTPFDYARYLKNAYLSIGNGFESKSITVTATTSGEALFVDRVTPGFGGDLEILEGSLTFGGYGVTSSSGEFEYEWKAKSSGEADWVSLGSGTQFFSAFASSADVVTRVLEIENANLPKVPMDIKMDISSLGSSYGQFTIMFDETGRGSSYIRITGLA